MEKIPSAEEFIKEKLKEQYPNLPSEYGLAFMNTLNAEKAMIWMQEYSVLKAKIHVTQALKQAYENAEIETEEVTRMIFNNAITREFTTINKDSILNVYDLNLIK